MTTIDDALRRSLAGAGQTRRLTLDPAFQGLPAAAHGGSLLALFHLLAGEPAPATVQGAYRRRVPVGTPLRLHAEPAAGRLVCRVLEGEETLAEGRVDGAAGSGEPITRPAPAADAAPLPISFSCLACGTENPLGLRARLVHDADAVTGTWTPRDIFASDGRLAPLALTTLLDEAAFWLGALASGESGMTTELTVRVHAPVPFGRAITVGGLRRAVRQRPDDPRYWETAVAAWDEDGGPVADGRITFVAVRGAARRLVAGMLAMNPPEVVRRVFPAYVPWRGAATP